MYQREKERKKERKKERIETRGFWQSETFLIVEVEERSLRL
jgi:hypothetical protein